MKSDDSMNGRHGCNASHNLDLNQSNLERSRSQQFHISSNASMRAKVSAADRLSFKSNENAAHKHNQPVLLQAVVGEERREERREEAQSFDHSSKDDGEDQAPVIEPGESIQPPVEQIQEQPEDEDEEEVKVDINELDVGVQEANQEVPQG